MAEILFKKKNIIRGSYPLLMLDISVYEFYLIFSSLFSGKLFLESPLECGCDMLFVNDFNGNNWKPAGMYYLAIRKYVKELWV